MAEPAVRRYVVRGFRNRTNIDGAPLSPDAERLYEHFDSGMAMAKAICDVWPDEQWDRVTVDLEDGLSNVLAPDCYGTVMRLDRATERNFAASIAKAEGRA